MKTHLAVQALVFIVVRGSALFLWHDQFIRKITVNSLQLSCPRDMHYVYIAVYYANLTTTQLRSQSFI